MIRLVWRVALRLACSRDAVQRWRQLSVLGASFLTALVAFISVATCVASDEAANRRASRMPTLALTDDEPASLVMSIRGEIWRSRQFPVVWLAPGDSGPTTLPPGLTALPPPGTAVLSPGLIRAGFLEEGLGFNFSRTGSGPGGAIGDAGLASASEWLVYATPPPGRTLGSGGALFRVKGFGPQPGMPTAAFETEAPTPSTPGAVFGVLWLFALPSLLLSVSCANALSTLRSSRALTLFRLGVSRPWIRLLGALEGGLLAAPGIAVATALWLVAAPHMTTIPGTGLATVKGAFGIPVTTTVGLAMTCMALMTLLGAASIRPPTAALWTTGRQDARVAIASWRTGPLVLSLLLMLVARLTGGPRGLYLLLASLLLTMASFPFALPWLVRRLGDYLGRSSRPATWLAGRRLAFSSIPLARPAVLVAALLFLIGSLTGISQRLSFTEGVPGEPVDAFSLGWRDAKPGDIAMLREQLPQAAITLDPSMQATSSSTRGDVVIRGVSADLIWRKANPRLPAVNLSRLGPETLAPPTAKDWIIGAGGIGALILLLAAFHAFGNRILSLTREDRRLLRIALHPSEVRTVQRWVLIAPLGIAVTVGMVAALVFTWCGSEVDVALPVTRLILLESLVAGGVAALVAMLVSALQRFWLHGRHETTAEGSML